MRLRVNSVRGFETGEAHRATLSAGRPDLRGQAVNICPVCGEGGGAFTGVLYLHTFRPTASGKQERAVLGDASIAGYLCRVHIDCADWSEIDRAVGVDDEGHPVCSECASQINAPLRRGPKGTRAQRCYYCTDMLQDEERMRS